MVDLDLRSIAKMATLLQRQVGYKGYRERPLPAKVVDSRSLGVGTASALYNPRCGRDHHAGSAGPNRYSLLAIRYLFHASHV